MPVSSSTAARGSAIQLLAAELRLRRQHQVGVDGRLLMHVEPVVVREPDACLLLDGRAGSAMKPGAEAVLLRRLSRARCKEFWILHESAKSYGTRGTRTAGTTPPADPPDRGAKHLRELARGAGPGTKSEPPATRESAAPAAAGKRGERPETEPSGESRRKGDGGRQAARKRTPGAAPEGDRSAAPANRSTSTGRRGRRETAPGPSETHQREDESGHHGRETGDSGYRRVARRRVLQPSGRAPRAATRERRARPSGSSSARRGPFRNGLAALAAAEAAILNCRTVTPGILAALPAPRDDMVH